MTETAEQRLTDWLEQADGFLILASNGLSMAEGYFVLRPSAWFDTTFQDLIAGTPVRTPLEGMQYPWPEPKDFNAFYTRLIRGIHYDKPVSGMMEQLYQISRCKDTFVLTTNTEDRFVQAGFPASHVWYMEGRLTHNASGQPMEVEDLHQITHPEDLEISGYGHSAAFQQKLQDLQRFVAAHPRLLMLVLGVSDYNGYLRPLEQQILQLYPQTRVLECNLRCQPVPAAMQDRILDLEGPLETTISSLWQSICKMPAAR